MLNVNVFLKLFKELNFDLKKEEQILTIASVVRKLAGVGKLRPCGGSGSEQRSNPHSLLVQTEPASPTCGLRSQTNELEHSSTTTAPPPG